MPQQPHSHVDNIWGISDSTNDHFYLMAGIRKQKAAFKIQAA